MTFLVRNAAAQGQAGAIGGAVRDLDFDVPLPDVEVRNIDTGATVLTDEQGQFLFAEVAPGTYTLVFVKPGYVNQVKSNVVVPAGQVANVDVAMAGEYTEMEEFVVQDVLDLGTGTEEALLQLRFESPALLDSISAELMSRAGASDAASALTLVAGATVQNGKFAVIRGLPDRYVSSQMNGVRLPSADEDKRAVELDQFPSVVIESLQVSKTFTPDQQGDASGGAVNVKLQSIPQDTIFQLRGQFSYNDQVRGRSDFLTYEGGGVDSLGLDADNREPQAENTNWTGAVGVSRDDAPQDYKWSLALGDAREVTPDWTLGGFVSAFYERDSSFYDDGVDDSYWVETAGGPLTPQRIQEQASNEFFTQLFDVTKGTQSVQWGGLAVVGLEGETDAFQATYLYTHSAEDSAILAEDTRGKEFFFPGYDPNDPMAPGNESTNRLFAPYIRTETLTYTERDTQTLQLHGEHALTGDAAESREGILGAPEIDWTVALSSASLDQPDKRQFGSAWLAPAYDPGIPFLGIPPRVLDPAWVTYKPAANFTLGNLQRIWKEIEEDSEQYALNLKVPFEQWGGEEGYVKLGVFDDQVERSFDQETYSNFSENPEPTWVNHGFEEYWSAVWESENHPISSGPPFVDVDYEGSIRVTAYYGMVDLPLLSTLKVIAGARVERTEIDVVNFPEDDAQWFPEGANSPESLEPGEGDVDFAQTDFLPALGLVYEPTPELTLRGSVSKTVARQTFKELVPILQQEYLGGPVFIGRPDLGMAGVDNYDLRLDWAPEEGSLFSVSWFRKNIEDAIEYVQRVRFLTFTEPVNYPRGVLSGYEVEARQQLGRWWDGFEGLSVGGNATFISSKVQLPQDEIDNFETLGYRITSRDATGAPAHLYNLYLTFDTENTQTSLFYSVRGDTLAAGAGEDQNAFIPDVYEKEYGTLNASFSLRLNDVWSLRLSAKNLTNPEIEQVFRYETEDLAGNRISRGDSTKTSFTRGTEYAISLSATL